MWLETYHGTSVLKKLEGLYENSKESKGKIYRKMLIGNPQKKRFS